MPPSHSTRGSAVKTYSARPAMQAKIQRLRISGSPTPAYKTTLNETIEVFLARKDLVEPLVALCFSVSSVADMSSTLISTNLMCCCLFQWKCVVTVSSEFFTEGRDGVCAWKLETYRTLWFLYWAEDVLLDRSARSETYLYSRLWSFQKYCW